LPGHELEGEGEGALREVLGSGDESHRLGRLATRKRLADVLLVVREADGHASGDDLDPGSVQATEWDRRQAGRQFRHLQHGEIEVLGHERFVEHRVLVSLEIPDDRPSATARGPGERVRGGEHHARPDDEPRPGAPARADALPSAVDHLDDAPDLHILPPLSPRSHR
jgi:hypothetical protein